MPDAANGRSDRRPWIVAGIVVALAVIATAILLPQYYHVAPEELAVSEMFLHAQSARSEITENIARLKNVSSSGKGVNIEAGKFDWSITDDGRIQGSSRTTKASILLLPTFRDGNVVWTCKIVPERYARRYQCYKP